ncbi:hypothetical protein BD779DRAFT_1678483 [Infundibulicybe gibba]|nr:hypothetical protein BD779DRAFT_1678483 [Infundibulicybe gibba]
MDRGVKGDKTGCGLQDDSESEHDDLIADFDPGPENTGSGRAPRQVMIEEIEDEAYHRNDEPSEGRRWVEDFPTPTGSIVEGIISEALPTKFEEIRLRKNQSGEAPWAPFSDQDEWELARWLMKSGISQTEREKFLGLKKVRDGIKPSFHNNRAFLKKIDALPKGPEWQCEIFEITGDETDETGNLRTEEVELWKRNPVECVRELIGNPAFRENMKYSPTKIYEDPDGKNRGYDEMSTGDWWWETQMSLPSGATIAPIILSSDKTQLSRFSGDKQAWPPGQPFSLDTYQFASLNASKKPTEHFKDISYFIIEAGTRGINMICADGHVRLVFPLLAAYIADYPEQCLVGCCMENRCPKCLVNPKQRGEGMASILCDPTSTMAHLREMALGLNPVESSKYGLRPVDPFWKNLPHCNIFNAFMPDLLHQLHKGVFKDHIVSWATESANGSDQEIDRR